MNERSQDSTIIINPSCSEMAADFLTKMNGNIPTMKVMMKLMASGPRAESFPFRMETIKDRNINRALMSSACPTFLDITLISISSPPLL